MSIRWCFFMMLVGVFASVGYTLPTLTRTMDDPGILHKVSQEIILTNAGDFCFVIGAGVYFPTSDKVRNRFGKSWPGFGVSFGCRDICHSTASLGVDVNFTSRSSGSNYVYLLPVGLCYINPLPGTDYVHPYIGACADIVFSDIRSRPDNVSANVRLGTGVSVLTGVAFGNRWQVQARYSFLSSIAGFDFSGLGLSVSMNL